MRKLFTLLIVLFLWLGALQAITVQVGSGTATSLNLPITAYYGYSYSQQIYTQTQIAVSGPITKIRFYHQSGAITNSSAWVVYLGHTTKTTFSSTTDWVPLTSLTEVFNGSVTSPGPGNWVEITLSTPFNYNNTDNLVVAIDENTASYAAANVYWYSFTSGANTGIYYRADATNPNPSTPPTATGRSASINQIQFDITTADPTLDATPMTLSFPMTVNGAYSAEQSYSLSGINLTSGPITVTAPTGFEVSLTSGSGFGSSASISYTPPTLATTPVYVRFAPNASGTTFSGNVSNVGGGATKNIAVSGTSACDNVTSFTQNFDAVTTPALPNCWYKVGASGSAYTQSTSASSSPNCLYMYGSGVSTVISMPPISNAGAGTHQLRFKLRANFSLGEVMQVGYLTNPSDPATFVQVATATAGSLTYQEYIVALGTAPGAYTTIAFKHPGTLGYSILIDDVVWEPLPACPQPSSPTALPYGYQATLDWTEIGSATTWELEWGASGFAPGTGTVVSNITTKPYILMGLAPSTAYAYYVRADCGGGSTSAPTGPKVFTTTVSCPAPTLLNSSNITVSTADINWTSNGLEAAWDIIYGPAGFVAGSGIGYTEVLGTSTKPYPLTALSSGTTYDYYVRAACGVSNVSAWSAKGSFTTVCEVISAFPHSQNFDGAFPPACWSRFTGVLAAPSTLTAVTSGWVQDDWRNVAGTDKAAKDNIWSTSHYNWLVTPAFDLATDMQLEFDLALNAFGASTAPGLTGTDDKFAVVISTDGGVTWSSANTLRLWDNAGSAYVYNSINPAGERIILDLSAYTRSTVKIGFYGESTVSNADNDLMINNLVVQEPPSCAAPYSLTATPAGFQAVLGWTEAGTATEWEIEYGLAGFTPGTGTPVLNVTVNPYTLTGLTPSTAYNFYVKANCGPGLVSLPSVVKAFTTTVACPQPTALTATNISTDRADLGWTEAGAATTWNVEYGEVPWTQGTGTMLTGVTTNPVNISGLSAAKTYSFYVQADCGGAYQSLWSGPTTFNTACETTVAPFTQDFELTLFPPICWTNASVTGTYKWSRSTAASGNGAGSGSAYANFYSQSAGSTYELTSNDFNISALTTPTLKFNYAYATYSGEDDEMDVYYSIDNGANWLLLLAMPGGTAGILNTGGTTTDVFTPTASQWGMQSLPLPAGTNKIKFQAISAYGNNLFLDNIQVYSPLAHDASAVSVDIYPVINTTSVAPTATVRNEGTSVETFDVTMTIGAYTSTKTVTALAAETTQQVTFDPWTPVAGNYTVDVCVSLTGDLNAANDCTTKDVKAMNLNKTVYGYRNGTPEGPVNFSLSTPGTLNLIADQSALQGIFGATWANGLWYGAVYNTVTPYDFVTIDPVTGTRTVIGDMGISMTGLAYNLGNNTMYGASYVSPNTNLYSINMTTGAPTLIGTAANTLLINLAINNEGVCYAVDILADQLGTVDLTTGAYTAIGPIGFDANYAQDMEFDRETGELYLAAYGSTGELRVADKTSGNTLLIGSFADGAEVTGLAIPYTSVTFQVNMSQQTVSPLGVFLAGNFQGWNSSSTPLTDMGGGVWAVTLALAPGDYQYKFINGTTWESVPGACNISGNRYVTITNSTTLPLVCFGSCSNCINQIPLTLTVDMANQTVSPLGVHVAGSFQGWNPGSTLMTQIPSTTMYEVMVYVDENSTHQYKFINGNDWPDSEVVPEACGVDNGFGGFNRTVTVTTGMYAADVVCFGECSLCATDKTLDLTSVLPEGLYAGGGMLNQAFDDMGPHFGPNVADVITVELHSSVDGDYSNIIYSATDVPLSTSGTASISVPAAYAGSYYITIRHRNSIQTVSATPVSFAGSTITQSFGAPEDVFGANLLLMADMGYAIFGGDVNQDDLIDSSDAAPVDNEAAMASSGYMPEDVNGDGLIDSSDASIIDNSAALAIGAITP